jgi:hypothetical protein
VLDSRWPVGRESELLYALPTGAADAEYTQSLNYRTWNGEELVPLTLGPSPEIILRTDALLRGLELQIHEALGARDFQLVRLTNSVLVFRPLLFGVESSHGVGEELREWEQLAQKDADRRAVFVHFKKDIDEWRASLDKDELRANIRDTAIRLAAEETGFSEEKILEELEGVSFLKRSRVLPAEKRIIREAFARAQSIAPSDYEYDALTLSVRDKVRPDQVHLVCIADIAELKGCFGEIINFLKTGEKPAPAIAVALETIAGLKGTISLARTRVVADYYRYDDEVRRQLQVWRERIEAPLLN